MNRLQQLREAAALSRADLARRSDVSQTVIDQLEAGAQLTEGERAVEVPGETPVENIAVILTKLADALGANLFSKGIAVTSEELLGPAHDDLPTEGETTYSDETQPALPLVGINYAPAGENLPPEARSHNETATPDDIDAALKQLALDAEVTASQEAAATGANEVTAEPDWPDGPVSPAASTAEDPPQPSQEGLAPTGGTETINMAELPDSLPIGVLPDTPPLEEPEEIPPASEQIDTRSSEPDRQFASRETQKISIPPEVLETPPQSAEAVTPAKPASTVPVETMEFNEETPTLKFDVNEVKAQAAKDTTELETEEMAPVLAGHVPVTEMASTETPETPAPGATSGTYEAVSGPDMPGPAPAPETMEAASEAHPEPPVLEESEGTGEEAITPASPIESVSPNMDNSEANLGLPTAHEVAEVAPNPIPPLVLPVEPTPLELEAAVPAQDVTPLTKSQPEQQPEMQPYISPGPSEAAQSRYKLPPSTVIPSVIGVVGVIGWFLWRSWRRSRAEAERVAPYYKKK